MKYTTHYICLNCGNEYHVGQSQPVRCDECGSKEREELTPSDTDLLEMLIELEAVNTTKLSDTMVFCTREELELEYKARIRASLA